MIEKKAILTVSHGTAAPRARAASIDILEKEIASEFPDREVRRAFTSAHVRARIVAVEGLKIDSTEDALQKLIDEGFVEVWIQPTHVIPGDEYGSILDSIQPFRRSGHFRSLKFGRPLLYYDGKTPSQPDDYRMAVEALRTQLPEQNGKVLLLGHGTGHEADSCYDLLQARIEELDLPMFIATMEGSRTFAAAAEWLEKTGARQVTLMPFMLVAGGHVLKDMAGPKADSWQNRLQAAGWETEPYLHGLGENPAFRRIYIEHVKSALSMLE